MCVKEKLPKNSLRKKRKKKNLVSFSLPLQYFINLQKSAHKFDIVLFFSFIEYCILYIPSKGNPKITVQKVRAVV